MDFDAVFTVRFTNERYIWRYELHPPHLINVATLRRESQNTENVILYSRILPKTIASDDHSFIKKDQGHYVP